MLRCPLCHQALRPTEQRFACEAGHSFDRARDGHVNLYRPGKVRKERSGDDVDMVRDRRAFLGAGHYAVLSSVLGGVVADLAPGSVLDVGCGEGSFTRAFVAPGREVVAFDLSVAAVRLAARLLGGAAVCAVASVQEMPAVDGSVDLVASVMSPVHEAEFRRVLAPEGRVLVVTPGAAHLDGLRKVLYREYRPHDEALPLDWPVERSEAATAAVHLRDQLAIRQVWGMTPYRWNAPAEGVERLDALSSLELTVDFRVALLRPPTA